MAVSLAMTKGFRHCERSAAIHKPAPWPNIPVNPNSNCCPEIDGLRAVAVLAGGVHTTLNELYNQLRRSLLPRHAHLQGTWPSCIGISGMNIE